MNFDDVLVIQTLEYFSLHEYVVDICCRAYHFSLYCFDRYFLFSHFVLSQQYFPEPALPQLLQYQIFPKTARWIEILALRRIDCRLILDVVKVLFKILASFGIEQAKAVPTQQFGEV